VKRNIECVIRNASDIALESKRRKENTKAIEMIESDTRPNK